MAGWLAELEAARRALGLRVAGQDRWVAIEDAARFRDALGAALPPGVPDAFVEPVQDPLGDLMARFARTHGPFREEEPAVRLGLGPAVVRGALRRLEAAGRVVEGEFRPGGTGREWVEAEVLRRLRRRSLAALRREIEPAPQEGLARFVPAWQGVAWQGAGRGPAAGGDVQAVYRTVEQLQGALVPATALERQVLPARLLGYEPRLLDELCASGEVLWAGSGALGSNDGWVALFTAEDAPLLLPEPLPAELSPTAAAVLEVLSGRGALFFRQVVDAVGSLSDTDVLLAIWELVWAGRVTNDTLAPLRALTGSGGPPAASRPARRRRGVAFPSRFGPPAGGGRWSLVAEREANPTRRLHAAAEQLLERHGVVTRGAVMAERVPGGFAAVYPVLKAFEESGRCRRGYFVEGLGGAQFALPGAVDRMRSFTEPPRTPQTVVLAAADPANPYGAALAWPERDAERAGHRPGRKAGAVVVLVDGRLTVYVERGGRTLLTYSEEPEVLQPAIDALALAVREGLLGKLTVERADGGEVFDSPVARALSEAGFRQSARGLRLRG